MKRVFVLAAIFCCIALGAIAASVSPPQQAPRVLSLQDCINIAIAQNPDLRAAAAAVQVLEARIVEAHAPLLPNLSFFYNWTRDQSPLGPPVHATFGTFRSQSLLLNIYKNGLILNQLIYDGRKTASLFQAAEAARNAQLEVYRRLIQTLTFNTTRAYYQLLADRKLVDVARENLKDSGEHLKLAQASYKAGVAARADVIFAEVPVATARLNLTRANQAEGETQAALDRLLSFDVNTPLALGDDLKEIPYGITEEQAAAEALRNRDEIKQANSLVEEAREQLAAAEGGYWPVISAFANYGYTDYGANILPGNLGYSYGLQATFQIFDGNLRNGQVSEAKAALAQNEAALESTQQDVLLDVKNAFLAFTSAKESVNEARVELSQANENLRLVEGQYKVGVVPILNLLDAETSKTQAEQHLINALSTYQIAIGQLKLAMGN